MAASPQQKLKARLLLGLTLADVSDAADALSPEELAELQRTLDAAEKLELRTVEVDTDGVKLDQAAQLNQLRARLANLLGVSSAYLGFVGTVSPDEDTDLIGITY